MDELFKKSYIEKCVKAGGDLEFLRVHDQPSASVLRVGDFFYHEWMGAFSYKRIQDIHDIVVFSDDGQQYPKYDCTWVPSRDQLVEGLKNKPFSVGDTSGLDEEGILEKFMEKNWHKKWDEGKKEWVEIK